MNEVVDVHAVFNDQSICIFFFCRGEICKIYNTENTTTTSFNVVILHLHKKNL